jgi:hypothetical protein
MCRLWEGAVIASIGFPHDLLRLNENIEGEIEVRLEFRGKTTHGEREHGEREK